MLASLVPSLSLKKYSAHLIPNDAPVGHIASGGLPWPKAPARPPPPPLPAPACRHETGDYRKIDFSLVSVSVLNLASQRQESNSSWPDSSSRECCMRPIPMMGLAPMVRKWVEGVRVRAAFRMMARPQDHIDEVVLQFPLRRHADVGVLTQGWAALPSFRAEAGCAKEACCLKRCDAAWLVQGMAVDAYTRKHSSPSFPPAGVLLPSAQAAPRGTWISVKPSWGLATKPRACKLLGTRVSKSWCRC